MFFYNFVFYVFCFFFFRLTSKCSQIRLLNLQFQIIFSHSKCSQCMHACARMCFGLNIELNTYVCMHLCMQLRMCMCMCMCVCVYVYVCIYIYIYMYVCMCIELNTYVYVCICKTKKTHAHTHIYEEFTHCHNQFLRIPREKQHSLIVLVKFEHFFKKKQLIEYSRDYAATTIG